ncbi:MAG TPA: hypothetical protein VKU02_24485 [Gemmataceae bacterium]|nr:hypothetical protein [Gemmataceae bacterium]
MNRLKGFVCAGGFVAVLLAGCASLDLVSVLSLPSPTTGHDRVVAGSLEVVAQSAQTALGQMGLAATVNRQGETIRIASKSPSGAKFTLVLTREKTKDSEQTRAHVEWEGASDDQMGLKVLAQLESGSHR